MTSHKKMITNLRCFSFGFYTIHNIWSFFEQYISFWDRCLKFLIFQYWEWAFGFLSTIHFNKKSLSFFPNQILVCVTVFAAHYLFLFWHLHWLSSLSIYIYIYIYERVGRYINTSLHMYQNQHDYWLIIHDKLENRFITITHRCQDFSHKDIST